MTISQEFSQRSYECEVDLQNIAQSGWLNS